MHDDLWLYDLSDYELVALSRHGNNAAFDKLVERNYRRCLQVAKLYLHNEWDAEDQVVTALSKAYVRLNQYHGDAEFRVWLLRIVANQCLVSLRQRRRLRLVHLNEMQNRDGPPPEFPACGSDRKASSPSTSSKLSWK